MVENKAATVDSAYVLTALAYVIILTRLALRRLKHERFKVDDYLMGLAMVFYALNTAVYPVAVSQLRLRSMAEGWRVDLRAGI